MGWKLTSRTAYESAQYSVLDSDGDMEIREYPELKLATTNMGAGVQGDDGSFSRLFRYISGNNQGKQKVAMTTPVFMSPESEEVARGQMSFVIPKDVAESTIPAPGSGQVQITSRPAGEFAVIRFAGQIELEICKQKQTELETWIKQQGYTIDGNAEVAGYDPPWTPGPLRRNEILIRVQRASE